MLKAIVEISLRHRSVVAAAAGILVVYGAYVTATAHFDVFPDFVPPQAEIQTEAPGFSPGQVETLVTRPLENVLNGVGNQRALRSVSIQGLSVITVVFTEGSDVFRARQLLAERLTAAAEDLPRGVKQPKMTPLTSSTMDLLKVGLVSDTLDPMELRSFAQWQMKPRLLSVPGVADINIFGGEVRQLQVRADPDRLAGYGLTIQDVIDAARSAATNRGTGFIDTPNQRITVRTPTPSLVPSLLGSAIVAPQGNKTIRLRDVGRVVVGPELKVGDCLIQGRPGVLLALVSQYRANTLEVTRSVEAALDELKPMLAKKGITLYPRLHRPATFIETALHNIRFSITIGATLVALVLLTFLGSLRTAMISLAAIPLSLLAAVIVLNRLGVTLNTITIGGLAIAIGEVVDDAIIDVENIFRRLRQSAYRNTAARRACIVRDASLEVRSAVVYATLIVVLAFLPVLTLTGLQGSFFSPLALSYILAVLASLLVALTVTPALAYSLLGSGVKELREPPYLRWIKAGYESILRRIARFPRLVLAVAAAITVLALGGVSSLGGRFLPSFREGHFVLQVVTVPGTSFTEMLRLGKRISQRLLDTDMVATVEQQIGRAELGVDAWSPNRSEIHVELKPMSGNAQIHAEDRIRAILRSIPGIEYEVTTFLGDRIGESISGETADVVVNVFGKDLDALDDAASQVAAALRRITGAADVRMKSPPGAPRVVARLRPNTLARFGFQRDEVLQAIAATYRGAVVGQVYHAQEVADVVVILDDQSRQSPTAIASLMIRSRTGTRVRLGQLADVYESTERASISHEGARRRRTVTCNVRGRDLTAFVAEARQQLFSQLVLPPDVYISFTGAAEARSQAQTELLLRASIAGTGVLLLLMILFDSWPRVLLVLVNLPFALVGGILSLQLARLFGGSGLGTITLGSLVGFVTLFGITMRNSIMLLSHYEHLVTKEGMAWTLEAAVRGALERLVPIVMTAMVTGLALVPLAVGANEAGRETEGPMAIVILGGLVTSTFLNLLVLPTLALRFGDFGLTCGPGFHSKK